MTVLILLNLNVRLLHVSRKQIFLSRIYTETLLVLSTYCSIKNPCKILILIKILLKVEVKSVM